MNKEYGLDPKIADAISKACDEVGELKHIIKDIVTQLISMLRSLMVRFMLSTFPWSSGRRALAPNPT